MIERPSLHALAIFAAVVEHRTMTLAAEVEGISQPAISMHVKALERFFGVPLLERHGRHVRPTSAGVVVADYARRLTLLTDELSRMVADLEALHAGRLVIGASSTVGEQLLPTVLGRFHRAHPGVGLSLRIGNTGEIVDSVVGRSLDLGIVGRPPDDAAIEARPIFDDELDVFVAPDHPLAGQEHLRMDDLTGATFVVREAGSATRDLALQALADHGCVPGDTIELGSNEAVKRAVSAGLGVGILSSLSVAIDRRAGLVRTLSPAGWDCRRQFWLIHRQDRQLTRAEQAFIAML
jgi:DNA-binding transcriptional LysR family regulator